MPLEKKLTLPNVIILIKSVLNQNQNNYYYNMFLETCLYQLAKKIMTIFFFDSITMFRFDETKVTKEEFYNAKKPINICDVIVDNIIISNLTDTKNNSTYLIGCLDEVLRPLFLICKGI